MKHLSFITVTLGIILLAPNTWAFSEGESNNFFGVGAGFNTPGNTGGGNVFMGGDAGFANTSGSDNVFVGNHSGFFNSTGRGNTFLGYNTGRDNTTGIVNTFIGLSAGVINTTGSDNIFIGRRAGLLNETGSGNTFIGGFSGTNSKGSDNVFIGKFSGMLENSSNKLFIENSVSSNPLIYGEFDNDIVGINGTLGVGTQLPTATLHVRRSDGTARVLVEETNVTTAPRTLLQLNNNGNTKLIINNTSAGVAWVLNNTGDTFRISRPGSGAPEFKLTNSGSLTIQGTLTELSSRKAKHQITPLNPEQTLSRVLMLPIKEWSYKDSKASIRHIGPMAEDFHQAFGLGHNARGIASLDTSGVALAAIQGLKLKQDKAIAKLKMETDHELAQRDARFTALQKEKDTEITALQTELTQLRNVVQQLIANNQWASAE